MLETERLVIRPPTILDAQNLYELNLDPLVMRYTGDNKFHTISAAREYIEQTMIPQFDRFRMNRFFVFQKDGTFIGWCGLKYFPETDEVNLGYRFRQEFWGQGFATESAAASMNYGFEALNLRRIIAKAMPENLASIKVLQKLKMTFRGYQHDPTDPHPFLLYEKIRASKS